MKTVHFHVGAGRCGSSLIQALFNDVNMHEVFTRFSLKYDPEIYLALTELTPIETFNEADWRDFRDQHIVPLKDQAFHHYFITQENLFGIDGDNGGLDACRASSAAIDYLMEGFRTRIVILVRRQDTYIESIYSQHVKRREVRDFATYLDELPWENLDWGEVADIHADRFGRENVTVLPFEKRVLNLANIDWFVTAVLRAIGVTQIIEFENLPTVNPSVSPRAMEVQRLANKLLTEDESLHLANWFEANIPKSPEESYSLMSEEQRADVLDFFRERNRRLCSEYMPDYDPAYYLGEDAKG